MPERGRLERLARLFLRKKAEAEPAVGTRCVVSGRQALSATEAVFCDALCHGPGEAPSGAPWGPVNTFGLTLVSRVAPDAPGVVATASGMAAVGRRVAAFLPRGDLAGIRPQLAAAVERRLPIVFHAVRDRDRPDGIAALAQTGAFILVPRNAREAVDLTIVARCVAERSLTPGVVVCDGPEIDRALQDVELPPAEMSAALVGHPRELSDSPTPAQQILFGEQRPRVPAWIDPDRPATHAALLTGTDLEAGEIGRRLFFDAHLEELVAAAIADFEQIMGRRPAALTTHRLEGARYALVAQGAAVETAMAVADHLRRTSGTRIGVMGLPWLHPTPDDVMRRALQDIQAVTVLEPEADRSAHHTPLMDAIRDSLPAQARLVSASYRRLTAGQVAEACGNMATGERMCGSLRLTSVARRPLEGFPRLKALRDRVAREYEDHDLGELPPDSVLDLRPSERLALTVLFRDDDAPEALLQGMVNTERPFARGRTRARRPGLWEVQLLLADRPLLDPGEGLPADAALILGMERMEEAGLPVEIVDDGALVVATDRSAAELWLDLPPAWREQVRKRSLRIYRVPHDAGELLAAAELIAGGESPADVVDWRKLPEPPRPERELPLLVRRFEDTGTEYDNVSRFWGEYAQPLDGGAYAPAPDPYLALGSMPVCSSTFRDRTPRRERHPRFDPAKCSGCGACWTSCPDSAIAPVALPIATLLDVAADGLEPPPGDQGRIVAGRLRRSHAQLAQRVGRQLTTAGASTLTADALRDAYDGLVSQLRVEEEQRAAMDGLFAGMLEGVGELPLSANDAFFHEAEQEKKGSGALLMIAFNPQACQACGICAAVCDDEAIRIAPQSAESLDAMRAVWRAWESLPDTAGATIARASAHPRVGPLPSVLLSRHCLFSVAGGDSAEAGSGARVAVRQVLATVEYESQRRFAGHLNRLGEVQEALDGEARQELAHAVELPGAAALADVLGGETDPASASDLVARLQEAGGGGDVDVERLRRLAEASAELAGLRGRLTDGQHGTGRSRFGILIAGSAAGWAAQFPRNPFCVPVEVDLVGGGADLALGLAEGWLDRHAEEMQTLQLVERLLDGADEAPAPAGWAGLTAAQRELCPPLIVLAGTDGLGGAELPGLSRLLDAGLPLRVLLLDPRDLREPSVDPTLLAVAHRQAFVLASSIAHPRHLFAGVGAALGYDGPALIHVHAPSPSRDGYSTERTIARARDAVDSRVHPLVQYDPAAEGTFGLRLDITANPQPNAVWTTGDGGVERTPLRWAGAEARFQGDGAAALELNRAQQERADNWETLREVAGLSSPFTRRIEERLEGELREAHEAELVALRADHERRLAEARRAQAAEQTEQLRVRLLQLAGFGRGAIDEKDRTGPA